MVSETVYRWRHQNMNVDVKLNTLSIKFHNILLQLAVSASIKKSTNLGLFLLAKRGRSIHVRSCLVKHCLDTGSQPLGWRPRPSKNHTSGCPPNLFMRNIFTFNVIPMDLLRLDLDNTGMSGQLILREWEVQLNTSPTEKCVGCLLDGHFPENLLFGQAKEEFSILTF